MKKLTAQQIKAQDELVFALEEVAGAIKLAVFKLNENIATAREIIQPLTEKYNNLIVDANAFRESVYGEQDDYFNNRSDKWREGDAGQNYEGWMDEWSADLEDLEEVELPDDIEEPDFDAITVLSGLPELP